MPIKLHIPRDYKPREQFSPSGLDTLERCGAAWFKRYVEGIKEGDLASWWEVRHLPEPEQPSKDAAPIEWARFREESKEYKRLTRRALGQAIHHCLQVWYDWHPPLLDVWQEEEWSKPCAIAMAGLDFMPMREDVDLVLCEQEWRLPFGTDERDPFDVFGFIDLVVRFRRTRQVKIYDYKSTGNLDWAPTPDEMLEDVQACDYALGVMVEFDLPEVECCWIYFCTDEKKRPEAWPVDFTITREQAVKVMTRHEGRAELAREAMRDHVAGDRRARTLPVVSKNATACGDFGGCVYHHERGNGGCRPPALTTGQELQLESDKRALLEKRREYRRAVLAGEHGQRPRQPRALLSAPHERKKEQTRHMAKQTMAERLAAIQNGEGGDSGDGASDVEQGTQGSGRRRAPKPSSDSSGSANVKGSASKGKPSTAGAAGVSLSLVVRIGGDDPVEVPLPAGTPVYDRNMKVVEALLGV